jgi:membrane protein
MTTRRSQRLRHFLDVSWKLGNATLDEFSRDRGDLVAAALAFYTLLSLAPLIIIAVAVAGTILGEGNAHRQVQDLLRSTMGASAATAVDSWVQQASSSGALASLIGGTLTLVAASRFTTQLRSALNQVWNVDVSIANGFKASVKTYVKRHAFALALVIAAGPLLLAIVVSRTLLTGLGHLLFPGWTLTGSLIQVLQLVISFGLVLGLSTVVFRVIPDTRVGWRAAFRGAVLTSTLFNVGNLLVGLYLGKASVAAAYGAAGSLVVVLLWLYFSAEMFLLGAEFTQVYSTRFERGLEAKPE